MKNKKLSIVIPTFNGGLWLRDTVLSVVYQLKDYSQDVEFIIRDNASTDNTNIIVNEINSEYGGLVNYYRRNETVDADTNFRESILLCSGEYIVLLGDDDLIFPNYIRNTLELIENYKDVGLFYYNRIATSREYEGATIKHNNPNLSFCHFYNDVKDFISDYPSGPDFMSVNVIKRDCIARGLQFAKKCYYGVEWYSAILYGLQGYSCLSLFYPMILQRAPKTRYWDDRALLYVIIGVDNMFSDLDNIYPGIYDIWNKYSKENCSKFWYLTKCIPLNRELYKTHFLELKQKLSSGQEIIAKLLINIPVSYYLFRTIYLLWKIFTSLFSLLIKNK